MNGAFQTKDGLGEVCPCYASRQVRFGLGLGKKERKKERKE